MNEIYQKCLEAADFIRTKFDATDAIGIVLGSGLGDLADEIMDAQIVDYADIPNYPKTTVPGHAGQLIFGYLNGVKVLCMKGRFHFYEGHDMKTVAMPTRVMKLLGVKALILTNAAGGVNRTFKPGTLMVINDFINYMGDNPLYGPNVDELGPRFPDMTKALDPEYTAMAVQTGKDLGIDIREGVYMSFRGPNFETPAEIRFAEKIGADAVGMSTVPEVMVAVHGGVKVLGFSVITDMGLPDSLEPCDLERVIKTANDAEPVLSKLVRDVVKAM